MQMLDTARLKFLCFSLILALAPRVSATAQCGPFPKSGTFLSYAVEPKPAVDSLTLEISVSFRLSGSKATELILPFEWEGQKGLDGVIRDLQVVSPGSTLLPAKQTWRRRLEFNPGQTVQLRYSVVKDCSGKIDSSSYFRVLLHPSYFQVAGRNFLVYPDLPEDEKLPICVEWRNLPQGWKAVDSLTGDSPRQDVTAKLIKLTNGLFAGGDLRITKINVQAKPVSVATRGTWEFSDDSFADLVQRVLAAERRFWQDNDFPNYLITVLPSDDTPGSFGAAALEDSFMLLIGESAHLDFALKFALAHEMFHSWNAAKLGEVHEEVPFWFIEGFTDYYARLLLLRSGLITQAEYNDDVRRNYQEYRLSRVLHVAGKQMESKFFDDTDMQRMAYLRGDFLAMRWDQAIRQGSGGKQTLDDAMLALFHLAQQKEVTLTDDFLGRHFSSYIGSQAVSDTQKYIEQGETIPLAGASADSVIPK